jgi:phosphopantothenoylcysteine decarboxylase/phosphopantothenate--cysteine ligase
MGFALAEALAEMGAEVCLISGPVQIQSKHPLIERIDVESASQMYDVVLERFYGCDGAILCAAVADFTPVESASSKMKREKDNLTVERKPTQDIAAAVGQ